MRRTIASLLSMALLAVVFVGCSETSTVEAKKTIETPNGKTEVKQTTEVKKSGDAPPPATVNP